MESADVAVAAAPVVTKNESSFTESSQENKVEKVSNGTVESSAKAEKSVTQSVQSSVQASDDQTVERKRWDAT